MPVEVWFVLYWLSGLLCGIAVSYLVRNWRVTRRPRVTDDRQQDA